MIDQYKYQKSKLIGYFIDELVEPDLRSPKSLLIIKIIIEKFYPNLKNDAQADITDNTLNELELF